MIKYDKPINLNGKELREELRDSKIDISDSSRAVILEADGYLYLDIDPSKELQAKAVVGSHNGTMIAPEPTVAEKLASVGLSLDDLKEALGL